MQDFLNLRVWKDAYDLSIRVYKLTKRFHWTDRYLKDQTRSSAFSTVFNIAEGCGRATTKDQAHFFTIAFGSASELQCQLMALVDVDLISENERAELHELNIGVKKMLSGLLRKSRSYR